MVVPAVVTVPQDREGESKVPVPHFHIVYRSDTVHVLNLSSLIMLLFALLLFSGVSARQGNKLEKSIQALSDNLFQVVSKRNTSTTMQKILLSK